jgi:gluconokinase
MFVLVMGVTGAGKTTIGALLAERLGFRFIDADEFHSETNRVRLSQGVPLTESDREPWLRALRAAINRHTQDGESVVLACSALKAAYRDVLLNGLDARAAVVYLRATKALIAERLQSRHGHFASPALLESQLETLQEPTDVCVVDTGCSVPQAVERILLYLAAVNLAVHPPSA